MSYINRQIEAKMQAILHRRKSILLLGARQTGKTTLAKHLAPDMSYSFVQPDVRQRYERNPSLLINEIKAKVEPKKKEKPPLILIDEVQKIPAIMDSIQIMIDENLAQFIITGSSARKLRRNSDINLLPGRVIVCHLDPLSITENQLLGTSLDSLLYFGSLPEICQLSNDYEKVESLESYVVAYLEEEIRAEAVVRNVAHFSRFIELAAIESGNPVNFSKLSQDIGISHSTISSYFQILVDCLIAERVEPLLNPKSHRRLMKASKYLIFDHGIRRIAAKEGFPLPATLLGHLFEQFIGLEIIRFSRQTMGQPNMQLYYWRDLDGPEVDWVVKIGDKLVPIEVKLSETPTEKDARHLKLFMEEYPQARQSYIICRTPVPIKIADNIAAIPWTDLPLIFGNK